MQMQIGGRANRVCEDENGFISTVEDLERAGDGRSGQVIVRAVVP